MKFRPVFTGSLFVAISLALAAMAHAQAGRTYVSGVGDDVNPCSRTAPCKTFAGAIAKTAAGGEIDVLDPGGYGAVVIAKSITIDGTGTEAGILANSTTAGVTINITNPSDAKTVRLRGLSINGTGTGTQGIQVIAGTKVTIEDCVIDGFTTNGVYSKNGAVFISNSTIRNNAGTGLNVAPGSVAALSDVNLVFNGTGLSGDVTQFNNVVLYGNKSGDPPLPRK